jgi:lysozyme family protein
VPTARSGPSHFSSGNPRDLQVALQQLGRAVGGAPMLMRIVADGKLGPAVVAATNRALTVHLGPGQAPAQYRTGTLTLAAITTALANITQLISAEAARRATLAVTTGRGRLGPDVPVGPPLPPRQAAMELQQGLNALAAQTRDNRLKVGVDGKIGPGTARAVNIALTTHVGPGQAPAGLRTGTLSVSMITSAATQIATIINTEARRRSDQSQNTGPGYFNPAAGGVPMGPPLAPRAAAIMLQQALAYLARETHDKRLAVKADGAIGPGTTKAVNIAFTTHIGPYQAGGVPRTGTLTVAYVKANAQMLGTLVSREAARRHFGGGTSATPGSVPQTQVPTTWPGSAVQPGTYALPSRAANKILQTRLGQLGRVNRDATLMITADGVVGPRTVAAVNKAFTSYITSAPSNYTSGSLTAADVNANAQSLSEYVGQALQSQGTSPATAPPGAEVGPNAEGEGAATTPAAPGEVSPLPAPSGDDGAPPPPPPPPAASASADDGSGGGGLPAPSGGGAITPSEAALGPEGGSRIPWVPIAIGVGLAAVTVVVVLMTKKSPGSPAYKQPARRRAA